MSPGPIFTVVPNVIFWGGILWLWYKAYPEYVSTTVIPFLWKVFAEFVWMVGGGVSAMIGITSGLKASFRSGRMSAESYYGGGAGLVQAVFAMLGAMASGGAAACLLELNYTWYVRWAVMITVNLVVMTGGYYCLS